jgi:hypothetical protein
MRPRAVLAIYNPFPPHCSLFDRPDLSLFLPESGRVLGENRESIEVSKRENRVKIMIRACFWIDGRANRLRIRAHHSAQIKPAYRQAG